MEEPAGRLKRLHEKLLGGKLILRGSGKRSNYNDIKDSVSHRAPRARQANTNGHRQGLQRLVWHCQGRHLCIDRESLQDTSRAVPEMECKAIAVSNSWTSRADIGQPAVSKDCSKNFWVGNSYCVGVGPPKITTTTTSSTTSTSSVSYSWITGPTTSYIPVNVTSTAGWPPSPTQSGQPPYCATTLFTWLA